MSKLLLLDVTEQKLIDMVKQVECQDLDDFYKYLKCSCFDIARRKIGGKYYDIFVDDEGLLKEGFIVSAIDSKGNAMLVGNLIFANHDAEGNTTSLSEEDIANISNNICLCKYVDGDNVSIRFVLTCEY